MRFMMLLKADKRTEAGELPTAKDLEVMGRYNEELVKAGVLLDGAGLQPSSKGAKVIFQNGKPQVTDGPFVETKELLAGYWMINVKSKEEAIEWAKRAPFDLLPHDGRAAGDRIAADVRARGLRGRTARRRKIGRVLQDRA